MGEVCQGAEADGRRGNSVWNRGKSRDLGGIRSGFSQIVQEPEGLVVGSPRTGSRKVRRRPDYKRPL